VHERAGRASGPQEVSDQVQHLRVQNGRRLEVLPRGRRSGKDEDPGANDRPDSQRGERPWPQRLLKTVSGLVGFRISLSMDLQQRSWCSDVRADAGCAKGFWSPELAAFGSGTWRLALSISQ